MSASLPHTVGDALPPFEIASVDPQAMMVWADLLHDPNPIHLDVAAVKAAGLGDKRINQGPANLAYILNMLARAFPDWRVETTDVRFMGNVLEGDCVVAGGTVTSADAARVSCNVWLEVDGRGRALAGTATLISNS